MRSKTGFTIVFALSCTLSFGYHPILKNTVWLSSEVEIEGYINSLHTIVGDTVINGTSYKIIYKEYILLPAINNNPFISGYDSLYFREDTVAKQLIQYYQWMGEKLVFDFSLQPGDSMPGLNYHDHVLTTIDSIPTSQGYRKRLIFTNSILPPIIWVEGLGNLSFPFSMESLYDSTYAHLLCVHENGNLVYEFQNYIAVTCSLYNSIRQHPVEQDLFLYPNPVHDILQVYLPSTITESFMVEIFDSFGKKVFEKSFGANTDNVNFDLHEIGLSKGIYQLRIMHHAGVLMGQFLRE
jgi:hypothetical protein